MKKITLILTLLFSTSLLAKDFVKVIDGKLYHQGQPYFFMGTNFWQGMNLAIKNPDQLKRELNQLESLGVKQLRIMALSEGPDSEPYRVTPAVITRPTQLREDLLIGLDLLLVEMKKRQMTAVVCLSNFWPWSGGFAQWVSWFEKSSIPYPPPHPNGNWSVFQEYSSRFYTIPQAVKAQQEMVKKIITRTNSLSGIAYTDDPTIMSWELANEPRGGRYRKEFQDWIKSSAKLIKSLDKNHLLTVGSEGETMNPLDAGNDFLADHALSEIDYTTIHVWVENWGVYDPKNALATMPAAFALLADYIKTHAEKTKQLKKPMILEEFGIARDLRSMSPLSTTLNRDQYYQEAFLQTLNYMKNNGIVSGVNFWAWSGEARPKLPGGLWRSGDDLLGDPPHEEQGWYGVYNTDKSTLKLIQEYAQKFELLKKKSK
jgi:mannan endo-1,4-beta-mannosidase